MTVDNCKLGCTELDQEASKLAEQGKFHMAIAKYSAAIELCPEEGKLYEQLAQCFMETEQYPEAYSAAAQAVRRLPKVLSCRSAAYCANIKMSFQN